MPRRLRVDVLRAAAAFAVVKLRGLVAVVLIAHIAGVSDYGVWVQVIAVANLLGILGGLGLSNGIVRFYPDARTPGARRELLSCTTGVIVITALSGGLIMFLAAPLLGDLFGGGADEDVVAFRLGSLIVVGSELRLFFGSWLRARNDIPAYSRWIVIGEATDLLCSMTALLAYGTIAAALGGSALALLVVTVVLARMAIRDAGGLSRPSWSVRQILRYSVPLIPVALSDEALARADRLIVGGFLGPAAAGTYSAIYALASTLQVINVPLTEVIFPRRVRLDETDPERSSRMMAKALRFFGAAVVVESAGIGLAGPTVLRAMVDDPVPVPHLRLVFVIVTVGVGLYGVGRLLSLTMFVDKRTGTLAVLWASSLGMNAALNLILVPWIELAGAALATLVSYALFAWLLYRLSRRAAGPSRAQPAR